jgi:hypothetical protein
MVYEIISVLEGGEYLHPCRHVGQFYFKGR